MSISPLYPNPVPNSFPVDEQQLHLFLSPRKASSSSGPTFFNTVQDQRRKEPGRPRQHDDQVIDKNLSCGRFSNHKLFSSSSLENARNIKKSREGADSEGTSDGLEKWMPSKIRLMQKTMSSSCSSEREKSLKFKQKFQDQWYHSNEFDSSGNSNNNTIRVCADCSTTTTPLWRSGPQGPKSLCNACGIRRRKARRAMLAATTSTNGAVVAMESPTPKKTAHREKKSRTSHVAHCPDHPPQTQKKLCFKNLALKLRKNSSLQRVLPQDVEEAATLLMELSCGFIHS